MEKKIIRVDVGIDQAFDAGIYSNDHTPIDELLQWLNEVKAKGATHIDWKAVTDHDGYSDTVEGTAFFEREETDEEGAAREAKLKEITDKRSADLLKQEKEQYERLKKKFETGN